MAQNGKSRRHRRPLAVVVAFVAVMFATAASATPASACTQCILGGTAIGGTVSTPVLQTPEVSSMTRCYVNRSNNLITTYVATRPADGMTGQLAQVTVTLTNLTNGGRTSWTSDRKWITTDTVLADRWWYGYEGHDYKVTFTLYKTNWWNQWTWMSYSSNHLHVYDNWLDRQTSHLSYLLPSCRV